MARRVLFAVVVLLACTTVVESKRKPASVKKVKVQKGDDISDVLPTTTKGFLRKFHTKEGSSVVELEEGIFKTAIDAHFATIVLFYMPNSKLCDNLRPPFEKAAQILQARSHFTGGRDVLFAQVNLNQKRVIAEHFNITHVPHIRVFKHKDINGAAYDGYLGTYNEGMRTAMALVNYAMNLMGFPLVPLEDEVDLRNLKKTWMRHKNDAVAVGFFEPSAISEAKSDGKGVEDKRSKLLKQYIKTAAAVRNMTMLVSTSKTLADKFKVTRPAIIALKNFDDRRVDLPWSGPKADEVPDDAVASFIANARVPRLVPFDPSSRVQQRSIWEGHWANTMVVFDTEDEGSAGRKAARDACRDAGTQSDRGSLLCVSYPAWANKAVGAGGMALYYGIDTAAMPAALIQHQAREKVEGGNEDQVDYSVSELYLLTNFEGKDSVAKFMQDFEAGTVKRYYRTRPASSRVLGEAGQISNLIGRSFSEDVEELRAPSGLLLRISEQTVKNQCSGSRQSRMCPANFTLANDQFDALASDLAGKLNTAEIDSYYNDLPHFAPGLTALFSNQGDDDALFGAIADGGPQLVYYPTVGDPVRLESVGDDADKLKAAVEKALGSAGGGAAGGTQAEAGEGSRDEL